ncbi:MAG: hypothetical protein GDA67_12625 [Nitrospira sp. CR1.3]|nr:hypothetical protein [Nitrospira sp. CR1.3]
MRRLTGWLGIGLALGLSACAHTMPADAPVVDRVLGDQALREQLVARGTQDEHFVRDLTGIESSLGSWPSISTTTRRSSERYFRNWRRTERFRIGYLRGCVGSRNRIESATSHEHVVV